jgi:hypothetical protein
MSRWLARRAIGALPIALLGACTAPNPAYRGPADGPEPEAAERFDAALASRRASDAAPALLLPADAAPLPADAAPLIPDAAPPPADAPRPVTGLIGYWTFEKETGTMARDWSVNANHGFLENLDPARAWVADRKGGTALSIPTIPAGAQPAGVRIPANQAIDDMRAFTISAWFFRTAAPNGIHQSVISRQLDATNNELFNITCQNQELIIYIPGTGGQVNFEARIGNTSVLRTWIHAAATYDGSTLRLFVNGVEKAFKNNFTNRLRSSPGKPIYIGANVNNGFTETFEGSIDEVALYSRALLPADIARLAGGATPFDL